MIRLALYILYYSSMRLARAISNAYKLMDGSIYKRWSSHEDELCVVNLPSSEDLIIAVDFQRFTDYHPEEILDVNKRRDLNCDLLHRRREERSKFTRGLHALIYYATWPIWKKQQTHRKADGGGHAKTRLQRPQTWSKVPPPSALSMRALSVHAHLVGRLGFRSKG